MRPCPRAPNYASRCTFLRLIRVWASAAGCSCRSGRCYADAAPGAHSILEEELRVRALRERLEAVPEDATARTELARALGELHALPEYQRRGFLTMPEHQYSAARLLGDQATITSYQEGMLIHGRPVQFLDPPSMQLPIQRRSPIWAVYNPSLLLVDWLGQKSYLLTYRVSTWNLCTWDARASPVSQLPLVDGKLQVTSKLAASILQRNFDVAFPMHEIGGLAHKAHSCNHHTGMRRVGVDDGRLFMLDGKPCLIYAAVALKGQSSHCFHHLFLCTLELPTTTNGKVQCVRKVLIRSSKADEVSAAAHEAGYLSHIHQKNWSPIVVGDSLYLVFMIEPFIVLHVDHETGRTTQVSEGCTAVRPMFSCRSLTTRSTWA